MNNETILSEAARLTSGQRHADYGHPIDDHTRTAKMWSAILDCDVTAAQVCLCMVALKMSRQCNKPKRDNLVDGCGYLRNVEMIEEETNRRVSEALEAILPDGSGYQSRTTTPRPTATPGTRGPCPAD